MKTKRKLLAYLLSLAMVLGTIPMTAFADESSEGTQNSGLPETVEPETPAVENDGAGTEEPAVENDGAGTEEPAVELMAVPSSGSLKVTTSQEVVGANQDLTVDGSGVTVQVSGTFHSITVTGGATVQTKGALNIEPEQNGIAGLDVQNGTVNLNHETNITVTGDNSSGIHVSGESTVNVKECANVTVDGSSASAVHVAGANSYFNTTVGKVVNLKAVGAQAKALYVSKGTANFYQGVIFGTGQDASGVYVAGGGALANLNAGDRYGDSKRISSKENLGVIDVKVNDDDGKAALYVASGGKFSIHGRGAKFYRVKADGTTMVAKPKDYTVYLADATTANPTAAVKNGYALSGGTFIGKVFANEGNLYDLLQYNAYVRQEENLTTDQGAASGFAGKEDTWMSATDGTKGLIPVANEEAVKAAKERNYAAADTAKVYGMAGTSEVNGCYYNTLTGVNTVVDAEWELREVMGNKADAATQNGNYQIPQGIVRTSLAGADKADTIRLDVNAINAEDWKYAMSGAHIIWGCDAQGDVEVRGTHTLYLGGRDIYYNEKNAENAEAATKDNGALQGLLNGTTADRANVHSFNLSGRNFMFYLEADADMTVSDDVITKGDKQRSSAEDVVNTKMGEIKSAYANANAGVFFVRNAKLTLESGQIYAVGNENAIAIRQANDTGGKSATTTINAVKADGTTSCDSRVIVKSGTGAGSSYNVKIGDFNTNSASSVEGGNLIIKSGIIGATTKETNDSAKNGVYFYGKSFKMSGGLVAGNQGDFGIKVDKATATGTEKSGITGGYVVAALNDPIKCDGVTTEYDLTSRINTQCVYEANDGTNTGTAVYLAGKPKTNGSLDGFAAEATVFDINIAEASKNPVYTADTGRFKKDALNDPTADKVNHFIGNVWVDGGADLTIGAKSAASVYPDKNAVYSVISGDLDLTDAKEVIGAPNYKLYSGKVTFYGGEVKGNANIGDMKGIGQDQLSSSRFYLEDEADSSYKFSRAKLNVYGGVIDGNLSAYGYADIDYYGDKTLTDDKVMATAIKTAMPEAGFPDTVKYGTVLGNVTVNDQVTFNVGTQNGDKTWTKDYAWFDGNFTAKGGKTEIIYANVTGDFNAYAKRNIDNLAIEWDDYNKYTPAENKRNRVDQITLDGVSVNLPHERGGRYTQAAVADASGYIDCGEALVYIYDGDYKNFLLHTVGGSDYMDNNHRNYTTDQLFAQIQLHGGEYDQIKITSVDQTGHEAKYFVLDNIIAWSADSLQYDGITYADTGRFNHYVTMDKKDAEGTVIESTPIIDEALQVAGKYDQKNAYTGLELPVISSYSYRIHNSVDEIQEYLKDGTVNGKTAGYYELQGNIAYGDIFDVDHNKDDNTDKNGTYTTYEKFLCMDHFHEILPDTTNAKGQVFTVTGDKTVYLNGYDVVATSAKTDSDSNPLTSVINVPVGAKLTLYNGSKAEPTVDILTGRIFNMEKTGTALNVAGTAVLESGTLRGIKSGADVTGTFEGKGGVVTSTWTKIAGDTWNKDSDRWNTTTQTVKDTFANTSGVGLYGSAASKLNVNGSAVYGYANAVDTAGTFEMSSGTLYGGYTGVGKTVAGIGAFKKDGALIGSVYASAANYDNGLGTVGGNGLYLHGANTLEANVKGGHVSGTKYGIDMEGNLLTVTGTPTNHPIINGYIGLYQSGGTIASITGGEFRGEDYGFQRSATDAELGYNFLGIATKQDGTYAQASGATFTGIKLAQYDHLSDLFVKATGDDSDYLDLTLRDDNKIYMGLGILIGETLEQGTTLTDTRTYISCREDNADQKLTAATGVAAAAFTVMPRDYFEVGVTEGPDAAHKSTVTAEQSKENDVVVDAVAGAGYDKLAFVSRGVSPQLKVVAETGNTADTQEAASMLIKSVSLPATVLSDSAVIHYGLAANMTSVVVDYDNTNNVFTPADVTDFTKGIQRDQKFIVDVADKKTTLVDITGNGDVTYKYVDNDSEGKKETAFIYASTTEYTTSTDAFKTEFRADANKTVDGTIYVADGNLVKVVMNPDAQNAVREFEGNKIETRGDIFFLQDYPATAHHGAYTKDSEVTKVLYDADAESVYTIVPSDASAYAVTFTTSVKPDDDPTPEVEATKGISVTYNKALPEANAKKGDVATSVKFDRPSLHLNANGSAKTEATTVELMATVYVNKEKSNRQVDWTFCKDAKGTAFKASEMIGYPLSMKSAGSIALTSADVSTVPNKYVEITIPTGTPAGTYYVKAEAAGEGETGTVYKVYTIEVYKVDLSKNSSNAAIALASSQLVYNGTEQTKEIVSVQAQDGEDGTPVTRTLNKGLDYTISGNAGTYAGNYTVTITGKGDDYTGKTTTEWTIAKKDLTPYATVTANNKTADGTANATVSISVPREIKNAQGVVTNQIIYANDAVAFNPTAKFVDNSYYPVSAVGSYKVCVSNPGITGTHASSYTLDLEDAKFTSLTASITSGGSSTGGGGGGGGGGGAAATYDVTISGGHAAVDKASGLSSKETVTLTVDEGYKATVKNNSTKKEITLTAKGNNVFTFAMPAAKVTVTTEADPSYTEPSTGDTDTQETAKGFAPKAVPATYSRVEEMEDIASTAWYKDNVNYVMYNGLMQGVTDTTFAPNRVTTRAMIITVIARMNGVESGTGFGWYRPCVEWAMAQGISDGTKLEANITRQEIATMLYRYAAMIGKDGKGTIAVPDFSDKAQINDWAEDAIEWAASVGVLQGSKDAKTGALKLRPKDTATRYEVATLLRNFCEKVLAK